MKCAVVGSRTVTDYQKISKILDMYYITEIISGGARGVDSLAEIYAQDQNIPLTVFKPDWDTHKRAAGIIRNRQIVDNCDMLLAFWDGDSRGTKFSIEYAKKTKKMVDVWTLDEYMEFVNSETLIQHQE